MPESSKFIDAFNCYKQKRKVVGLSFNFAHTVVNYRISCTCLYFVAGALGLVGASGGVQAQQSKLNV